MSTKSLRKTQKPLVERAGLAAFWNVAFFPLKIILPLLASIVTVRGLKNEGFALYSITTALLYQFGLLSDLGIERTLPRFYPEIEMRYGRKGILRLLFWVTAIKGGVLLLIIAALALAPQFWISMFQMGPYGGLLLFFVGLLLVLGAASDVSIQLLYTHFRQKITSALDVLAAVAYPILTASFILLGWGVLGAVLALLLTTIVSVILSVWQAWKMLRGMDPEPHPDPSSVKRPSTRTLRQRLVSFAGLNYLINWTVFLYDRPFLVLALGVLLAAPAEQKVAIGVITVAYNFTRQFLRALVVPLTGVQTPLFARLYAEGRIDGLRTAYATLTKFLILALLPSAVGLALLSRNLLTVLYLQKGGDKVVTEKSLPDVVACTVILAVGLFGEAIISVVLNVLMVYEDYRAVIVARLVALSSIPLLFLLVPTMGVLGAAIAASVAALGSRLVALFYAHRRLGLRFPAAFLVRVGLASTIMAVTLLPLLGYLPINLLTTAAIVATGAVVFYVAFRLLGGIDQADKDRFLTLRLPFIKQVLRFL